MRLEPPCAMIVNINNNYVMVLFRELVYVLLLLYLHGDLLFTHDNDDVFVLVSNYTINYYSISWV